MPTICEEYNLLYLHNPRTASTSMHQLLMAHSDGKWIGNKHETPDGLVSRGLLSDEQIRSMVKVTCIRNPWDDITSYYQKIVSRSEELINDQGSWIWYSPSDLKLAKHYMLYQYDFEFFIRERYTPEGIFSVHQRDYLKRTKNMMWASLADVVLRYESLQSDIERLFIELSSEEGIELPYFNETEDKRSYREYYTDWSRRVIQEAFYMDTHLFGYTF